jgi:hypothetical protein
VGTVTLIAPGGGRVWVHGLRLAIEEHLILLDGPRTGLMCGAALTLSQGQYIDGGTTFAFALKADGAARSGGAAAAAALAAGVNPQAADAAAAAFKGLREGYVGDMLALRHRLVVTATRPWYTFDVMAQVSQLAVHTKMRTLAVVLAQCVAGLQPLPMSGYNMMRQHDMLQTPNDGMSRYFKV